MKILWIVLIALTVGQLPIGAQETDFAERERAVALEQGRTLTRLFYDRDIGELYKRFSSPFRATMSLAQFEAFRQQVQDQLGDEVSVQDEVVSKSGDLITYTRTATFAKLEPLIAVEWTFDPRGVVEGFVVQPQQDASRGDAEAPSERLEYQTKTALQLPFDGTWYVFWGGRTVGENYHAAYPDQRFAADFVVRREGSSYQGDGAQLEDYYCFGRPIHAPGAGTVVETMSNLPDLAIGQSDTENVAGNYVIINHQNGEFSVLGHLQQGSVEVAVGDRVQAGTPIGRCGNSGNTSEPHLHYQLQAGAALYGSEALPAQFLNYRADGETVARGEPVRGQTVER